MKKYLTYFTTIVLALLVMTGGLLACVPQEVVAPGAEPSSLIPTSNNTYSIGTAGRQWAALRVNNAIYVASFQQTFPSSAQTIVGRTTTDTLTNKTLTSPTINGAAITGTVTGGGTYTGTVTIDDFVADNVTVTGGAISGATISVASPTITGTSVVSNRASGSTTSPADGDPITYIAHGLGSAPTIVFLTWGSDPGADGSLIATMNSTNITATSSTSNITGSTTIYWLALIAAE